MALRETGISEITAGHLMSCQFPTTGSELKAAESQVIVSLFRSATFFFALVL